MKGMVANLIIGEDTQLVWQLHTIRPNGTCHWKVGDSTYCIPGTSSPAPVESFTVQWAPEPEAKEPAVKPVKKLVPEEAKKHWNALAKYDILIKPESIAAVTAVAKGAPNQEAMYLEGTLLKRGSDSFICAPDGMVDPDSEGCFQIKIANTTHRHIRLRAGESLGQVFKANDVLKATSQLTENERLAFAKHAAQLAALTPSLDAAQAGHEAQSTGQEGETIGSQPEAVGWGPKTTEPTPDQVYPSERLREIIDVDPNLEPEQRDALYKVMEKNQAALGLDRRLGHLKTKVHIQLVPGTKPISMPPYYASPAKWEVIDKQIDLWLSQDIIEESKSPWGAPIIIVYRNEKLRICIDWRKLNKATIADQHPIPKQTDILQALSGAQYLSVFDALSGFMQMEFDEESRPITAICTHRGLHHFKRMPFGWRNRPPEFQRAMQEILSPYLWIFTLVYIDDVIDS